MYISEIPCPLEPYTSQASLGCHFLQPCLLSELYKIFKITPRCTLICDLHVVFKMLYMCDFITKLCRQHAEVVQNRVNENIHNIGQGETHQKI